MIHHRRIPSHCVFSSVALTETEYMCYTLIPMQGSIYVVMPVWFYDVERTLSALDLTSLSLALWV